MTKLMKCRGRFWAFFARFPSKLLQSPALVHQHAIVCQKCAVHVAVMMKPPESVPVSRIHHTCCVLLHICTCGTDEPHRQHTIAQILVRGGLILREIRALRRRGLLQCLVRGVGGQHLIPQAVSPAAAAGLDAAQHELLLCHSDPPHQASPTCAGGRTCRRSVGDVGTQAIAIPIQGLNVTTKNGNFAYIDTRMERGERCVVLG